MTIHSPKNRPVLTALLTLAAFGAITACSGDPVGPETPADLAAPSYSIAAPTPSSCSLVDGVWVCSGDDGGAATEEAIRCFLLNGVWVCEPTES